MMAGPGDLANRNEGPDSQPGASGGWRDAYRVLSLAPRGLPATLAPSIILGLTRVAEHARPNNQLRWDCLQHWRCRLGRVLFMLWWLERQCLIL